MAVLGSGVTINGSLATNTDVNTYTVHLTAGETYSIWAAGLDTPNGTEGGGTAQGVAPPDLLPVPGGDGFGQSNPTLADPFLAISGPGLSINDDDSAEGRNAVLTFTAPSTNDFTISVSTAGGAGGSYALNITNMSTDPDTTGNIYDIAALQKGANAHLAAGDTYVSSIEQAADHDVIAVDLVNGADYVFQLRGSVTGDGTLGDPHLELIDSDGAIVASNDDDGSTANSQLSFPAFAGATGTYYLVAHSHLNNATGSYELQFGATAPVDVPGDNTSTFNVPINGAVDGVIGAASDSDWYGFQVVAGNDYTFSLAALGGTLSPELFLHNSGGTVLAQSASGTGAQILFHSTTTETLFLDAHDDSTGTGAYRLSAQLTSPQAQNPTLDVTSNEDTLSENVIGSAGTDDITGGAGGDSIDGALGNDTLHGGLGADSLSGGATVGLDLGGNDSIVGDAGTDTLNGQDGSDTLDGGGDNDTVNGGNGADSLLGGLGADSISAGGIDTSADTADGGAGNDTISGSVGAADLLQGGADNDSIGGFGIFDTLLGGDGNDTLHAFNFASSLDGGTGDDSLLAGNVSDTLIGGDGNDTIDGGAGTNTENGGNGNDTFNNVDAGDNITAGSGVDQINSLIGWTLDTDEERLTLLGATNINGNGNAGGNIIFGNNGNNVLQGLAGNDIVNGGAGNDTLIGGAGKDLNTGSGGLDHIKYNSISDSGTTFATRDAINTFAHGDKIDLSAIDANVSLAGNQAFVFSTSQTLTHVHGQLIATTVATNAFLVQADVNGDGNADFTLNVYTSPGFGTFHSFDFIL